MKKFFASLVMLSVLLGFGMSTIGCGGAAKKAETVKKDETKKEEPKKEEPKKEDKK